MPYAAYLRLEGWCSIALGLALALLAFPGLLLDGDGTLWGLLAVPAVLLALGAWARLRHGIPFTAPGRWLTDRPLALAEPGRPALDAAPLRRRLVGESVLWVVAVAAWVLVGARDGALIFGTGLASAAFGVVQALLATAHVRATEAARGERYAIARRPGLGTPDLAATEVTARAARRTDPGPSGTTPRSAPRGPARRPSPSPPPGRT